MHLSYCSQCLQGPITYAWPYFLYSWETLQQGFFFFVWFGFLLQISSLPYYPANAITYSNCSLTCIFVKEVNASVIALRGGTLFPQKKLQNSCLLLFWVNFFCFGLQCGLGFSFNIWQGCSYHCFYSMLILKQLISNKLLYRNLLICLNTFC